jgi:hypothetical protein
MGNTTLRIGGNATQVTVRGGSTQRVTLDRRTVAAIANNRPTTLLRTGVTPVDVTQRDTVVRTGSAMGVQGQRGAQGPAGSATFEVIAGDDMTYPIIVAVVDGVAHIADPASVTDMTSQLAVTTQAAAAFAPITVATQYEISEGAWNWSQGRVYLALTGGGLTQTPADTGAILEVGRAVNATTIQFGIQPAILR